MNDVPPLNTYAFPLTRPGAPVVTVLGIEPLFPVPEESTIVVAPEGSSMCHRATTTAEAGDATMVKPTVSSDRPTERITSRTW
jgi:hypothetical protein